MASQSKRTIRGWLAVGLGLVLLAGLLIFTITLVRRPKVAISNLRNGTKDQIYYSRDVTRGEAKALGGLLRDMGYFRDRGNSVMLSRNKSGMVVSFAIGGGAWNRSEVALSFEQIGRHLAPVLGGFPIQVRLTDSGWGVQKSLTVGKLLLGPRDSIYYFGSATENDAKALGQALRSAGYLRDLGVSVVISKDPITGIGFVVNEGVWLDRNSVAAFANLARQVAASVGGLPVYLRLLNEQMEVETEVPVQ